MEAKSLVKKCPEIAGICHPTPNYTTESNYSLRTLVMPWQLSATNAASRPGEKACMEEMLMELGALKAGEMAFECGHSDLGLGQREQSPEDTKWSDWRSRKEAERWVSLGGINALSISLQGYYRSIPMSHCLFVSLPRQGRERRSCHA